MARPRRSTTRRSHVCVPPERSRSASRTRPPTDGRQRRSTRCSARRATRGTSSARRVVRAAGPPPRSRRVSCRSRRRRTAEDRCASPRRCAGSSGWKPTIGAVGRDGAPRWIDFSTWGASGHSVADVVAEASVYLGPTAGDVRSLPKGAVDMTLTKPSKVLLCRTLRLAVEPNIEAADARHRVDARRTRLPRRRDREPRARRRDRLGDHQRRPSSRRASSTFAIDGASSTSGCRRCC